MYWIITFPKKAKTQRISKRKDNVWTYLGAVVSPTSGSESPLGDNGSAGAGVSVGGSPHHPSCTSWSHMFCEGQGCIDKYTPCRGKCWSHTATRLCGDNMCLSEYQLEVTSLHRPAQISWCQKPKLLRKICQKRWMYIPILSLVKMA